METTRRRVSDKIFKCGSREITRHYFSLCKRIHDDGIAELATHLNTSHHRFEICRIREGACLDLDRIAWFRAGDAHLASAEGTNDSRTYSPRGSPYCIICCPGRDEGEFDYKRLQIRRVERSIAFPEGSRLNPIVARR